MEYLQKGVWGNLKPEDVQEAIQNYSGVEGEGAVDAAVQKIVGNLANINMKVPPWAPERPDMPVIDDDDVTDAAAALERGEIDHAEPHAGTRTTGDARRDINRESRSLLRGQLGLI